MPEPKQRFLLPTAGAVHGSLGVGFATAWLPCFLRSGCQLGRRSKGVVLFQCGQTHLFEASRCDFTIKNMARKEQCFVQNGCTFLEI